MDRRSRRLSSAREAVRGVLGNRNIRHLVGSWTIGIAAEWSFVVALLIVAYQDGGAFAVGAVGLARMVPATLVALFVMVPARVSGERAILAINGVRAAGSAVAAASVALGLPLIVAATGAGIVAAAGSLVRPTQAAMLPALARTPDELIAGNVGASTGEGIGTFLGPALGGIVELIAGPAIAMALAATGFALAGLAVGTVRIPRAAAAGQDDRPVPTRPPIVAGVRAVTEHGTAGLMYLGLSGQVLVRGLLTTLIVVASIELLGLGDGGVGGLNAAIGAGGFVGAVAALGLAGRPRLALIYALALAGWGLPIAVMGIVPLAIVSVVAMAALGISNAVLDITAFTLLQRILPNEQRAAAFGLLEGIIGIGTAAGGVIAPQLSAAIGIRGALIATGLILPVMAVVTWPRVSRADAETIVPTRELELLRSIPMFGLLPLTMVERLASAMTPLSVDAGETLIREGEPGDRFYIVSDGRLDVSAGGTPLSVSGPGDGIGEIALLRRVPRTATVTAAEDSELYALDGEEFLAAICEHLGNTQAADIVISARLARSERAAAG
jgi:hypothetical protein